MCGCRLPDAIAARPIHPKLGALLPPVVLVMTRPWYAGATATCAEPDGSLRTRTLVCCWRNARSESKPPVRADVTGWVAREHVTAARPIAPTIANRSPRPARTRMERSFYDH